MDAQAILTALQQAGFKVIGLTLPDPLDGSTWIFQPALSPDERAQAVLLVLGLLFPAPVPVPVASGPTLDQVIAWTASKLLVPEDQARTAILALPPVYVTPPKGP